MTIIPPGLAAMAQYKQFILWESVPKTLHQYEGKNYPRERLSSNGWSDEQISALPVIHKTDKIPVHPETLRPSDAHNVNIWTDSVTACTLADNAPDKYGVGFVFTKNDPFYFVDIDNCADPSSPNGWNGIANELMTTLQGAAVEVSQSGTGLHIFGTGLIPENHKIKYNDPNDPSRQFDFFTSNRFAALTFTNVIGDAAHDSTPALSGLYARYLTRPESGGNNTELTDGPCVGYGGVGLSDEDLITKALSTTSAATTLTGKASFRDLWTGNMEALAKSYPPDPGSFDPCNLSTADLALIQHLSFWTGNDGTRIQRLVMQSGLVRDKWINRADYLPRTIIRACNLQKTVYSGGKTLPTANDMAHEAIDTTSPTERSVSGQPSTVTGFQFMSTSEQIDYFRGCVYVQESNRVYTPDGMLLKPDQFRATYGGHVFALDAMSDKTTKNAWEAFTESQAVRWPKAHGVRFRPLDTSGGLITENGLVFVNKYVPRPGERIPGDVTPLLRHLELLIPDAGDREKLISYMAAVVQYPGVKFQWCPVIQGVPGNGKTAIYTALEYAVGPAYSFQLKASDADNKFNKWVEGHLLVAIEEIRVAGRYSLADELKILITNERVPIQGKGADQTTGDNYANFVMFSNHKDAVLKTIEDRRYCVFYTAQQTIEDLHACGMTGAYFRPFYEWLKGPGAPAVAHYLATREITVDVVGRAPDTTSTVSAYKHSMGTAEQIVAEAIEMDEHGFRGGMVSTAAAGRILQQNGRKLSPQAVAGVLSNLGMVRHPALESGGGRIKIENITYRIYVDRESDASGLDRSALTALWRELNGG